MIRYLRLRDLRRNRLALATRPNIPSATKHVGLSPITQPAQ
jgi:hypothetical protein